jgi:membrane-associated phospholipid phosphatase
VVEHRGGWLDPVFLAITLAGFGGLLWIALAPLLARRARLRAAVLTAAAVWSADLITLLVKLVVERPRPFETIARPEPLLQAAVGQSMPSGHAATSAAGALVLWYLTRRAAVGLVLLALAMGYSRVYVGAHYPFDVLAGLALGAAVAGCAIAAVDLRPGRRPSGIRPPGARAKPGA